MEDDEFLNEVLRLAQGHTVEEYDKNIKHQAQQLGISWPTPVPKSESLSRPRSTSTCVSPSRRSTSIASQASHSTGVTSNISNVSIEYDAFPFKMPRFEKRQSTNSVSFRDSDSLVFQARFDNSPRQSLNLTPPSTPSGSTFSLPSLTFSRESSPKRNLVRGLSRLKLYRRSMSSASIRADECQHCLTNSSKLRRPSHVLPCGHNYCTSALREIIDTASHSATASAPACCGQPIPGAVVRRIVSSHEQGLVNQKTYTDKDSSRVTASRSKSQNDLDVVDECDTRPRDSVQDFPKAHSDFSVAEQRSNLDRCLKYSPFRALRNSQEEQRNRFVEIDGDVRRNIKERNEKEIEQILHDQATQREDLSDKHMQNVSRVEDKHVHDEMDLRSHHETEARNIAIALRHMEAFCKGESASGERHHRIITEQDRRELAKTKARAEALEKKHLAEISVLRGEQTRRMNQRIRKQEVEVQQLSHRQRRQLADAREQHVVALGEWNEKAQRKRELLEGWWRIQADIWRKELEKEEGVVLDGPVLPVEWLAHIGDGAGILQEMPA